MNFYNQRRDAMALQGLDDGFVEKLQRAIGKEVGIFYSDPSVETADGRLLRVTSGDNGWEAVLSQDGVEKAVPVRGAGSIEVW